MGIWTQELPVEQGQSEEKGPRNTKGNGRSSHYPDGVFSKKHFSEFRTLNDTFGKLFKGSCIKSCATHQDEAIISSK